MKVFDGRYYCKLDDYGNPMIHEIDCGIDDLSNFARWRYAPPDKEISSIKHCSFRLVKDDVLDVLLTYQNSKVFNNSIFVDSNCKPYVFHISYTEVPIWSIDYKIRKGELGYGFYLLLNVDAIGNFWEYHVRNGKLLDKVNVYVLVGDNLSIRGGSSFIVSNGGQICWKSYSDAKNFRFVECVERSLINTYMETRTNKLVNYLKENSITINIFS